MDSCILNIYFSCEKKRIDDENQCQNTHLTSKESEAYIRNIIELWENLIGGNLGLKKKRFNCKNSRLSTSIKQKMVGNNKELKKKENNESVLESYLTKIGYENGAETKRY